MRNLLVAALCVACVGVLLAEDATRDLGGVIAQLGADNPAERNAAEETLAHCYEPAAARQMVEAYRTTENPEVRTRLGRILHADALAQADAVVVGRIAAVRDPEAPRCPDCEWGALQWALLEPAEVLKGNEFLAAARAQIINEHDTSNQNDASRFHLVHLPLERVVAGAVLLQCGDAPLMTVGTDGIWILRRGAGRIPEALGFSLLPIIEAARVRALLATFPPPGGTCAASGACPAFQVHAQSGDHTAGGTCASCGEHGIDICYALCDRCARERGLCPGCGKLPAPNQRR